MAKFHRCSPYGVKNQDTFRLFIIANKLVKLG